MFRLYWPPYLQDQPTEVFVGGSFNNWNLVRMNGSKKCSWCIIIDLPVGDHQYKFNVNGHWVHNPKEKLVDDGMGGFNNVVTVKLSDFEVKVQRRIFCSAIFS